MGSARARIGWVIFAVCLLLEGTAWLLVELQGKSVLSNSELVAEFALLSFGFVGAWILARHPGHRLGYVFLATTLIVVLTLVVDEYAHLAVIRGIDLPGWLLAAWIQNWSWFLPIGLMFTYCILLFPDGLLPSPRWRTAGWAAGAGLVGFSSVIALTEGSLDGFPGVENPTGVLGDSPLSLAFFLLSVAAAIASVASLVFRFRSGDTIQRLQLKFVMLGTVLALGLILGMPFVPIDFSDRVEDLLFGFVLSIFPIACGISILRYRLYDIDLIINRALVYTVLTAILAAAYLGLVFTLQQVLPLSSDSDVAVAASTLAIATLFRPLRTRVQAFIDRRFFRRKYDAAATLETFTTRLRSEVALEDVKRDVIETVVVTMQPAHVALWLRTTS